MNIGLLGFGSMGRTHSWAVENLKFYYKDLPFEAKIKGVYTRTPETRESAAKNFGFDIAAASEDELIYNDDIDIIDICTPNTSHYETLKKAINAGKHIYCEKPLCVNAAQAYEIAALADKRGVVGKIVFNNRYMSAMLAAKKLVDEGKLGRILSFRCTYLHSSCTDLNKSAGWKQNKDVCGGGVLFDLGSHAIDLVYHICGKFKEVNGRAQIAFPNRLGMDGKPWQTNADEAFYMIAELECGALGTIEASKIAVGANDDLTLEVYGTDGSLYAEATLSQEETGKMKYIYAPQGAYDAQQSRSVTKAKTYYGKKGNIYTKQFRAFRDLVRKGQPDYANAQQALHIQKLCDKIYSND